MHQSNYGSDANLKDIPLVLHEKIQIPVKPDIPFSYASLIKSAEKLLNEASEYNFHLEEKVLEISDLRRHERSSCDQEKWMKFHQLNSISKVGNDLPNNVESNKVPIASNILPSAKDLSFKSFPQNHCTVVPEKCIDSILQPERAIKSHNRTPSGPKNLINVAEFENDAFSPFDNLELKSINDIEELARILGNVPLLQDSKSKLSLAEEMPNPLKTNGFISSISPQQPCDNNCDPIRPIIQNSNSPDKSLSSSYPSNYYCTLDCHDINPFPKLSSGHKPLKSIKPGGTFGDKKVSGVLVNGYWPNEVFSHGKNGNQKLGEQEDDDQRFYTKYFEKPSKSEIKTLKKSLSGSASDLHNMDDGDFNKLKSSKSVPDLTEELKKELDKWEENDKKKSLHVSDYETQVEDTLTSSQKSLIKLYSEMGFGIEIIQKAVTKINDEKKLLDYLLLMEKLEMYGLPDNTVAEVILLCDYDEVKIKKHLEMIKQFIKLGFTTERISPALIQNDYNEDKVLDALLS